MQQQPNFDALQNKLLLIRQYSLKLTELKSERSLVNKKIKTVEEKFNELIEIEADPKQLKLFENMDELLLRVSASNNEDGDL